MPVETGKRIGRSGIDRRVGRWDEDRYAYMMRVLPLAFVFRAQADGQRHVAANLPRVGRVKLRAPPVEIDPGHEVGLRILEDLPFEKTGEEISWAAAGLEAAGVVQGLKPLHAIRRTRVGARQLKARVHIVVLDI